MQEVHRLTNVWPILYCGDGDGYRSNLGVYLSQKYDLWNAHYTYDPNILPDNLPWANSVFHQYSDLGTVEGIATDVDMNVFRGAWQDFQVLVLPVEVSSFIASLVKSGVRLRWRTESEINNYGFEAERRAINNVPAAWKAVGFVAGAGTSNSPHEYSFTDHNLTPGRYAYRIKQIDRGGSFKYYGDAEVEILAPSTFALEQNYPNPFNPSTVIRYALASRSLVRLEVFNALGQQISELLNSEQDPGYHEVTWQPNVSSGFYIYRIEALAIDNPQSRFVETRKALFVK